MKSVSTIFLFALLTSQLNAQQFRFGLSSGIDASRMAVNEASGTPLTYKNKLAGGVFIETILSKVVSVQAEANYSPQGVAGIGVNTVLAFNFNYITVPLLLKLHGNRNLSFISGAQLGLLLDAKLNLNYEESDYKFELRSKDFYAVFGAEYRFDNGVFVSGRYNAGLTDIAVRIDNRIHNRYISFRIGYSFGVKK
jgi:hypothetical protein